MVACPYHGAFGLTGSQCAAFHTACQAANIVVTGNIYGFQHQVMHRPAWSNMAEKADTLCIGQVNEQIPDDITTAVKDADERIAEVSPNGRKRRDAVHVDVGGHPEMLVPIGAVGGVTEVAQVLYGGDDIGGALNTSAAGIDGCDGFVRKQNT